MYKVTGNAIVMTRGDTVTLELSIKKDNGEEYELYNGDSVVLSLKKSVEDEEYVFQKTFVEKRIVIEHDDTKDLEFGEYVYDVQLTYNDGQIATIITPSKLYLDKEVHC